MKKATVGLVAIVLLAGCTTTPSALIDLGVESPGGKVSGSATYFGWFGMSFASKADVYERALDAAVDNAPEGTQKLGDVKLWTRNYILPTVLLSAAPITLALLMYEDEAILLTSIISVLVTGIEFFEYTVVGVPLTE
jgi:hypothetical protein